jgi:hypothetical protein
VVVERAGIGGRAVAWHTLNIGQTDAFAHCIGENRFPAIHHPQPGAAHVHRT